MLLFSLEGVQHLVDGSVVVFRKEYLETWIKLGPLVQKEWDLVVVGSVDLLDVVAARNVHPPSLGKDHVELVQWCGLVIEEGFEDRMDVLNPGRNRLETYHDASVIDIGFLANGFRAKGMRRATAALAALVGLKPAGAVTES